jgi:8-hydroxy-5-deazaflavin:NADPH oxidoreductase
VTRFLDDIGYDTLGAGPLASGGRRFQFGTPAFVKPYGGLRELGTPADVATLRAVLGE